MNKNKYIFFLLMLGLPLVFLSCSSDDEDEVAVWKAENEAFFDNLETRSDLHKIKAGSNNGSVYYKVLASGDPDQASPVYTSTVDVRYRGVTLSGFNRNTDEIIVGEEFDTSDKKLTEEGYLPATFKLSNLIEGWWVALQEMVPGDKWQLYIPWQLGYGSSGSGTKIPGYSTLIFEVELLKVHP
ncbi:MAG: FKBP-type peptidyl-prolyl cis-trans isomerase [Candidatus Azobacteroides sp.]|nr:FKBP-type peptidyl-prolyl cis-trans isomerase [Candidatus Azobacteroides sp.]